jgi:hypothetical protein
MYGPLATTPGHQPCLPSPCCLRRSFHGKCICVRLFVSRSFFPRDRQTHVGPSFLHTTPVHVPHTRHSPPPQSPLALAKTTHVPCSTLAAAPLTPPPSWTTRASDTRSRVYWTRMSTCLHTQKTGLGRHCTKPTPRPRGVQVSNGLAHYEEGVRWACLLG